MTLGTKLAELFTKVFDNIYKENIDTDINEIQTQKLIEICKNLNLQPKELIVHDPNLTDKKFQLLSVLLINSLQHISETAPQIVANVTVVLCSFSDTDFINNLLERENIDMEERYPQFAEHFCYTVPENHTTFFNTEKDWAKTVSSNNQLQF